MRRYLGLAAMLLFFGLASAVRADVRIDEPPGVKEPAPAPSSPPTTEPRAEDRGCAGRQMTPEWLFGVAVLAVGLGGMRRYRARQAAAA